MNFVVSFNLIPPIIHTFQRLVLLRPLRSSRLENLLVLCQPLLHPNSANPRIGFLVVLLFRTRVRALLEQSQEASVVLRDAKRDPTCNLLFIAYPRMDNLASKKVREEVRDLNRGMDSG